MRTRGWVTIAVLLITLAVSGCSHRLVAGDGQATVKVYQNEDVYNAAVHIKRALGIQKTDGAEKFAAFLNMLAEHESKDVESETRVKIVSSDAVGASVELLEGPDKGYKGFVPRGNLR